MFQRRLGRALEKGGAVSTTAVTLSRASYQLTPEAAESSAISTLTEPSAVALGGHGDALTQLLVALKGASDAAMSSSELRIQSVRDDIKQQLEDFLEKVREAAEQLKKADDDGGGWFGGIIDAVGSALGEAFGTIADAAVDAAKLPYDVSKAVAKNFGDTQAMLNALGATSLDLVRNGSTAADVKGFTEGVVGFCGDLQEYLARLPAEASYAALTGKNPLDVMKNDAQKLLQSLKHNILDNPSFWAVTGTLAKGAAAAAAIMSGGVLGIVAVGLMVALEAEKGTGLLEKAVGEKAAPWVRLGVGLAASVCLGAGAFAGGTSSGVVNTLQLTTGLVNSGGDIYQGYRAIQEANRQGDQIDAQAEILGSMNRMQQLQRLLDRLIGSLKDDSKNDEKIVERGASLIQTDAATNAAAIMPA